MRGPPHPSSPDCLLSGFISQRIPFTAGRLAGTRGAAPPRARSAFGAPGSASPLVRDAGLSPDRVCGSRGHQGPGRSVSRARLSGGAVGVAGVSGAQGRPLVAPLSPGSFRFRRLLPPRGLCGRKGANPAARGRCGTRCATVSRAGVGPCRWPSASCRFSGPRGLRP